METSAGTATPRWKRRPTGSNWGEFGPDDQLGRLNLLTPERTLAGIAEVRTGERFCLSLPLDYPGGAKLSQRRFPPQLHAVTRQGKPGYNYDVDSERPGATDVVCDDYVTLYTQYSTQWDSLAHVGSKFDADDDGIAEKVFYNGFRAHDHILGPDDGEAPHAHPVHADRLGIENMAVNGVQGRGVMIDLEAHFGREQRRVSYADLMQVMEADHVTVERGDMVCLRTGFAHQLLEWGGEPDMSRLHHICAGLDGNDARLLQWVDESGLAVLISDNFAVEFVANLPDRLDHSALLPLHELCLFKLGVHLGELWHLSELADWLRQQKRSRFLLTAPPLRLPGAVGSPVTPIATV